VSASLFKPAEATSIPSHDEKTCSAVGLLKRFWLQMNNTCFTDSLTPNVLAFSGERQGSEATEVIGRCDARLGSSRQLFPIHRHLVHFTTFRDHVQDRAYLTFSHPGPQDSVAIARPDRRGWWFTEVHHAG